MSPSSRTPGTTLTALVVEDSRLMREILTESLQGVPGLELAGMVATAPDAIAAFESHCPDVVVLDLALRVGSGLDVLRAIKQRKPACRVLVFSGHDEEAYRQYCLGAGADFFFSKNRQHLDLIRQLHTFSSKASSPEVLPGSSQPPIPHS